MFGAGLLPLHDSRAGSREPLLRGRRATPDHSLIPQRTLKNVIRASGVGLHTGAQVTLALRPAPAGTGVVFRRVDLPGAPELPARAHLVGDTRLSTTLECGGHRVGTVEHLLSALSGLGIDNIYADVDGDEVPIMDGSCSPFVFLIQSAGICEQNAPKRFLRVRRAVEVRDEDRYVRLEPYHGFKVAFEIDFAHPALRGYPSDAELDFSSTAFVKEISRARTFGFLQDVDRLKGQGLVRGGSVRNAVVVDDSGVMNIGGLRYQDEFVRHKILDAIGDLYLLGGGVIGAFRGHKSGHLLNNRLLRVLLDDPRNHEWVSFDSPAQMPLAYLQSVAVPA